MEIESHELTMACSSRVKHVIFHNILVVIVLLLYVLRRENSNSCEISHFPISKQTVYVQFSLDVLGKCFSRVTHGLYF